MDTEDTITEINESLDSMKNSLVDCVLASKKLLDNFTNDKLPTNSGISILELKNKMFLNYLLDLTDVIKNKMMGKINDTTVERLVEERVVLEKIRPIEDKLKYQIDILMKTNNGIVDNNPLNSKPDFSFAMENDDEMNENFDNEDDEQEEPAKDSKEIDNKLKNQVYVPPRLAQMKFEDEQERKARNLERAKKRAMNFSIINELRKEFDDAPEEESDRLINKKSSIGKYLKAKKKYEEDNFIRLNLTKKQKAQARKLSTVNSIGSDITKFEDISVLNIDKSDDYQPGKKKKKTKKFSNKKKKFKRR